MLRPSWGCEDVPCCCKPAPDPCATSAGQSWGCRGVGAAVRGSDAAPYPPQPRHQQKDTFLRASHRFLATGTRRRRALWRRHPHPQAGCQGTGRFVSPIPDFACSGIAELLEVLMTPSPCCRRAGRRWACCPRQAHLPVDEGVLLLVGLPAQPPADHAAVLLLLPFRLAGRRGAALAHCCAAEGRGADVPWVSHQRLCPE